VVGPQQQGAATMVAGDADQRCRARTDSLVVQETVVGGVPEREQRLRELWHFSCASS
jgi:hypothetical protein